MNNQLLAVFNFLVTVGGAFVFGYKMWDFTAEESPPMPMVRQAEVSFPSEWGVINVICLYTVAGWDLMSCVCTL